ncbi:hypothetical protein CBR_g8136 [Chara braunii]|uniref:CCHC-type domain-containing protein n=1 Tax=Chara braunii TaxID=69332 RepID=A0A388KLB4_CHABU|nr:hypothetical protein CBR_g8136 [Chara braunii]|eukprot:GBG70836.1 hypothetical protein CBR_g8136 [Chara braunii]
MEESSSQDVVPLSASPPVPTQAGQREDDGSNVVKTQEVHMISMPRIFVDTTEPSKRMDVSNALSSDAGATYGSLLQTFAALEGTSEMQSESGVGLSVPDSQLQPELCTGKGDAQVHLTPQGGAAADGGKGEDVEGILHPRNLETLTDDFDYGGEGGNDVVNTRGVGKKKADSEEDDDDDDDNDGCGKKGDSSRSQKNGKNGDRGNRERRKYDERSKRSFVCYYCGEGGHTITYCKPLEEDVRSGVAKKDAKGHVCDS